MSEVKLANKKPLVNSELQLQILYKKFDLAYDDSPIGILKREVDETIKSFSSLQHFAKLLKLYAGENQKLIMISELASASSKPQEYEDSNDWMILDFPKAFQELRASFPSDLDINICVWTVFCDCLLYILKLLHDDPESMVEIYDHFKLITPCILAFSETTILLETKDFKKSVSFFIADLMKVLTEPRELHSIKVRNLVRQMLSDLTVSETYCALIMRHILKRIKCALTYYKANEKFDGFTASIVNVFEHFFWILRATVFEYSAKGTKLDDVITVELKDALEKTKKFLKGKMPFVLMRQLENVVMILE